MEITSFCWEAALAEQRQHNVLPGVQALSLSVTLTVPETGSAAEAVSVSQAKGTRGE